MKGERTIAGFDAFLKRAKTGRGHTYQLHRKMGGAFIDAAFYNEDNGLVTYRIDLPEPTSIKQELRWDEHQFPYESETYRVGDKTVEVKFYRPLSEKMAFTHFLEDVIEELDEETAPVDVINSLGRISRSVERLVDLVEQIKNDTDLTKQEMHAVDTFFGNSDIWRSKQHFKDDLTLSLTEYLQHLIQKKAEIYQQQRDASLKQRADLFRDIEDQIINGYIHRLTTNGFKEGYVRR